MVAADAPGPPRGGGEGPELLLSRAELDALLWLLGATAGAGPPDAALESLRARRLIAHDEHGQLRIETVAVALVGTCLRPTARLRVVSSAAGAEGGEWRYHYLREVAVEQRVAGDGRHHLTAYTAPAALVRRLCTVAGVQRQARPAGAPLRLRPETLRDALAGAAEGGAGAVRRTLAGAGVAAPEARGLTRALAEPRRLTRLLAFGYPVAGGRAVAIGAVDLLEGPDGLWAMMHHGTPAPDADGATEVEVRPRSAAETVALLSWLVAALGWRDETRPAS